LNNTNCNNGTAVDVAQCGFAFYNDALKFCSDTLNRDPCCKLIKIPDIINNAWIFMTILVSSIIAFIIIFFVVSQLRMLYVTRVNRNKYSFNDSKFNSINSNPFRRNHHLSETYPTLSPQTQLANTTIGFRNNISNDRKRLTEPEPTITQLWNSMKVVVYESYIANKSDEITANEGDFIVISKEFDDGWALGMNITTGKKGVFPMAICEFIDDYTIKRVIMSCNRRSSL
jgi:uncharacterized protein YlzI (FlbEa/FlbD family)